MDSKKIIEQLVKIAVKQQKIINKLAQDAVPAAAVPAPDASNAPVELKPNAPMHMHPVAALKAKVQLNRALQGAIVQIEQKGKELVATFKPGQSAGQWAALQAAFAAAEKDQSLMPGSYSLSGHE